MPVVEFLVQIGEPVLLGFSVDLAATVVEALHSFLQRPGLVVAGKTRSELIDRPFWMTHYIGAVVSEKAKMVGLIDTAIRRTCTQGMYISYIISNIIGS